MPMAHILSHMDPVNILPLYFFKMYFKTIPLTMPRSYKWPLPFRFSSHSFVQAFLISPISSTKCPSNLLIITGEEYKIQNSLTCSFLQPPVTSPQLGTNTLLGNLFSSTIHLSTLNVRH